MEKRHRLTRHARQILTGHHLADREATQKLPYVRQDVPRSEYLTELSVSAAVRVEEFLPQFVLVLVRRICCVTVQVVLKPFDHICVKAVDLRGEARFFVSETRGEQLRDRWIGSYRNLTATIAVIGDSLHRDRPFGQL